MMTFNKDYLKWKFFYKSTDWFGYNRICHSDGAGCEIWTIKMATGYISSFFLIISYTAAVFIGSDVTIIIRSVLDSDNCKTGGHYQDIKLLRELVVKNSRSQP